ncbi:hypothetical protein E4191_18910 (plasmid) [Paracoccus liaowanqingii]|uniref:Uncharacterized protein n=1 Tax=Paracoccus liaowanqingii TaxID=2560053 RepID=A0A4Y5SSA2_9RHOB|nr:hypothetical protein [Paracoccus liaowanqingii]QDA36199.1 hypothetical protein E4191_18910 [Paracoccus liaowanqingii]
MGGQIVASSLMATTAIAQTTQIKTLQGSTVIVPDSALEESPSGGFVAEGDYPPLESIENYEAIAETLSDQGYSDIFIQREGPILTVTAQRAGIPTELVYSTANGRLVSVDGVETRAEPEGSSAGDDGSQAAAGTSDEGDDNDASDTPGGDDGAGDDGNAGADGGSDAGDGTDGGANGGSDGSSGSEADGGSDGSNSDGGSGSGSDGGSDSGDSDGGSDSNG